MITALNAPHGLLASQIGYDAGWPLRLIYRGPSDALSSQASFILVDGASDHTVRQQPLQHWGACWGSHWWIADCGDQIAPGHYQLAIHDCGASYAISDPLTVAPDLLWQQTWQLVGPDQAERRQRLARDGLGWYDAGCHWQEASSHVAFISGLCDLLAYRGGQIRPEDRTRIIAQIHNGCDYLAQLQDLAAALGQPGAVVHQSFKFDQLILPGDSVQAAFALARAANALPADHRQRQYRERAARALAWYAESTPLGAQGFSRINHGWPADEPIPVEQPTRELLMACRAALELARGGEQRFRELAVALADQVLARQIPADDARFGLYGHFRTFASASIAEKAWVHNGDGGLGADCGGHWPHDIMPLIDLCRLWPDHPQAARWRFAIQQFAYGYLLPACRANPFYLLPLGEFRGEGLLSFAGLWHGMNAAYALTAALAWELTELLNDQRFAQIVVGNLQWIAGLNAGLTAASQHAAHLTSLPVAPNVALPVSMINGIGLRTAGSWLNIRGAICNGFSSGDQFHYDLAATRANDGPHSFTDEDWITHAGAWLSATARLSAEG
jgi:hypothetical protein